ncbi:hypothetical protein C1706_10480 [Propioniciclava flava]|uniref:Uncharacterized protein n=1 Tax=Propioniciclava flava TaxID=2072026 RepID=A0A4Q2EDQ1_9ACTN|nr:hypothetical protein C1706_10480 [Propioniciclava flava]
MPVAWPLALSTVTEPDAWVNITAKATASWELKATRMSMATVLGAVAFITAAPALALPSLPPEQMAWVVPTPDSPPAQAAL